MGFVSERSLIHISTPISTALVDSHDDWWRSYMRPSLNESIFSPKSPMQLDAFMRLRTIFSLARRGTLLMTTSTMQSTMVCVLWSLLLSLTASSSNGRNTFKVSEQNNLLIYIGGTEEWRRNRKG